MLKKLLLFTVISTALISCKMVTQPMYVKTSEVAALNTGMTYEAAKATLGNLSPHDILMSQEEGCVVHQYKYKKPVKLVNSKEKDTKNGLSQGKIQYVDESDVFIIYKNGKLASVVTEIGKDDAINLMNDISESQDACSEKGLAGCTDPRSLSYDPGAIIDDGSCEYCDDNAMPNPNFNPKRAVSENNPKCIETPVESSNDADNCTDCDIIDKLSNSGATVNLNLNMSGSSRKSNGGGEMKNDSKISKPGFGGAKKDKYNSKTSNSNSGKRLIKIK